MNEYLPNYRTQKETRMTTNPLLLVLGPKFHSLSADPTKFFGCELGAQTQFDAKNDRFIVNGSHEANKLQDMLDGFIRKFVLCPECDNPETDLVTDPLLRVTRRIRVLTSQTTPPPKHLMSPPPKTFNVTPRPQNI